MILRLNDFRWGRYDTENNYNGKVGYVKDHAIPGRVTVFTSGKLISSGAKSIQESTDQLTRAMKLLVNHNLARQVRLEPRIRNVVATANLQNKIDLNAFASGVSNCIFEPEQFPGIIYKIENGATCLIFSSGKAVITGAKSEEQMFEAAELLVEKTRAFRI